MTLVRALRRRPLLALAVALIFCCGGIALAQQSPTPETKQISGAQQHDAASDATHGGAGTETGAAKHGDSSHGDAAHAVKDVSTMTPAEEMLEILSHKVGNSSHIHEYPFPSIHLPENWVVNVAGMSINLSPTRHVVYMWLALVVTILLVVAAARQNSRRVVPKGYGNAIESIVVFIRDEVAVPFLGHDARRFLPLLLSFFFFVGSMNLIGLLPFGATATGNINITAGLALITLFVMITSGMRANGVIKYLVGLVPHGIPWPLYIIMVPIELMGLITKPFALAIRLFANMLSGGLVIGAFYALIFGMDTLFVAPLSLLFLIFMSILKIFVCFLQAYIFTMLSTFFIGMSVHQEH
jgi:F-type H+-transporting ATPase subunit a